VPGIHQHDSTRAYALRDSVSDTTIKHHYSLGGTEGHIMEPSRKEETLWEFCTISKESSQLPREAPGMGGIRHAG